MLLSRSARHINACFLARKLYDSRVRRLMATPALTTSSSTPSQRVPFTGTTETELAAWLAQHGIPAHLYGTGAYKSVGHLLKEVRLGESLLTAQLPCNAAAASAAAAAGAQLQQQPPGAPTAPPQQQQQQDEAVVVDAGSAAVLRQVQVLNLFITDPATGKVLMEAAQQLPSGAVRRRGVPLAEKMLPGEGWRQAAARGVAEELGSVLAPGWEQQWLLLEETYRCQVETAVSASYPGLVTQFTMHRVNARLPGLPTADSTFQTQEKRPEGLLITTWEWRRPSD